MILPFQIVSLVVTSVFGAAWYPYSNRPQRQSLVYYFLVFDGLHPRHCLVRFFWPNYRFQKSTIKIDGVRRSRHTNHQKRNSSGTKEAGEYSGCGMILSACLFKSTRALSQQLLWAFQFCLGWKSCVADGTEKDLPVGVNPASGYLTAIHGCDRKGKAPEK